MKQFVDFHIYNSEDPVPKTQRSQAEHGPKCQKLPELGGFYGILNVPGRRAPYACRPLRRIGFGLLWP
jgi:hypothetical protein